MNRQPDPADLWLAENDKEYYREMQEAAAEDVLSLHMSNQADPYIQGLTILREQRDEVTDTLAN